MPLSESFLHKATASVSTSTVGTPTGIAARTAVAATGTKPSEVAGPSLPVHVQVMIRHHTTTHNHTYFLVDNVLS
jgi:hypothetical protein